MRRLKLYRGVWCIVDRINGRTSRLSLRTNDREIAERRFRDFRPEAPGDTIAEIVQFYLDEKRGVARSFKSMETAWRAVKPTFGHLRPDQVTRLLCRQYAVKRRKDGVTDGTIIKDLGFLRSALKYSKRDGGALFDLPSTPPPKDRYITKEEFDELLEKATLPHVRLFLILAWTTAGRASALLQLTWDRIDFQRGQIRLGTGERGRKGRATIPMLPAAREALRVAHKVAETDHVIEWGGKPVKSMKRAFATAARLAGIEDISPHVIRHSAAVAMAEKGVPMEEIGQFLGHTDLRVTYRIYARFSPGYLKRAAAALE